MTFNIACIQFDVQLNDPAKNTNTLKTLILQADNADVVILPELANSGYDFFDKNEAKNTAEDQENGDFVRFIKQKSAEINAVIVSGFNEIHQNKLYNSAICALPDGTTHIYRKAHLFNNEKTIFEAGNTEFDIIEYNGLKLGVLICFDWAFPEAWRSLALQGADLICHPSNLVLPYAQQAVGGHALCNQIYIASCNRIGKERSLNFTGNSVIVSPKGEYLARAGNDTQEIIRAKIDTELSKNKHLTPQNHIFEDRRTDLYRKLIK